MNNIGGVYRLYDNNELVYIGKTNNIPYRIGQHIQERSKKFDTWDYELINDEKERTKYETLLINKYKPKYNLKSLKATKVISFRVSEEEYTKIMNDFKESKYKKIVDYFKDMFEVYKKKGEQNG